MKISLDKTFLDLHGEPFYEDVEKKKPLSFKESIFKALVFNDPKANLSGEEKFKRYDIAKKVLKSEGEVELKTEELMIVKKAAQPFFGIEAYGAFCDLIEDSNKKEEPSKVKLVEAEAKT